MIRIIRFLYENTLTCPKLFFKNKQARVSLGKYTFDFVFKGYLEVRVTRISYRTVTYRIPSYEVKACGRYEELSKEIWDSICSYGEAISNADIKEALSQYDIEAVY